MRWEAWLSVDGAKHPMGGGPVAAACSDSAPPKKPTTGGSLCDCLLPPLGPVQIRRTIITYSSENKFGKRGLFLQTHLVAPGSVMVVWAQRNLVVESPPLLSFLLAVPKTVKRNSFVAATILWTRQLFLKRSCIVLNRKWCAALLLYMCQCTTNLICSATA